MQTLVFLQCIINTFVALIAKNNGKRSIDNVPKKFYIICATSYFLAMLFSNLALEWVNYPTQVCNLFYNFLNLTYKYFEFYLFRYLESHVNQSQSCFLAFFLLEKDMLGVNIFMFH